MKRIERALDEHEDHAGDDQDHPVGLPDRLGVRRLRRDRREPVVGGRRRRQGKGNQQRGGQGQEHAAHDEGILWRWPRRRCSFPPGVTGPFEVYVNGVRQQEGAGLHAARGRARLRHGSSRTRAARLLALDVALPRRRRHVPAERQRRRRVRGGREEDRPNGVTYPDGGADRSDGKASRNDDETATLEGDRRCARPGAAQLPDPARRRRPRAGRRDGARRHGGLQPARRRGPGRRPDLVRGLLRRPGRCLSRLRPRRARHRPRGRRAAALASGSRCVRSSPGSASSPRRTRPAASRSTTGRSGARACAGQDAVARVLALGALEYAVLAPAAMICAVVLLFGTGGHVQHAMTYPWLAVIPGFLAALWVSSPKRADAALRPGRRRAPAPVVRPRRRRDRQAPLPPDRAAPARPRRRRRQPLLARRHRLPLGGAEDLQRRDLDAGADPRLRDRLRRHAPLAAVRAAPGWSR